MVIIKKYSNRRLYDTEQSQYITLEELARKVRSGVDVQVIDAKSGADLTQATLTQIVVENRGLARLLPTALLTQLIRLGDDMLAEFFSRYVGWALQVYLQAKRFNPFVGRFGGQMPFGTSYPWSNGPQDWSSPPPPEVSPEPPPVSHAQPEEAPPDAENHSDDIAELRQQLAELREMLASRGE